MDVDSTDDALRTSFNGPFVRGSLPPIPRGSCNGRELKALQFAVEELNRLALLLEFLKFADDIGFADFFGSHLLRLRTCTGSRCFFLFDSRCGLQG